MTYTRLISEIKISRYIKLIFNIQKINKLLTSFLLLSCMCMPMYDNTEKDILYVRIGFFKTPITKKLHKTYTRSSDSGRTKCMDLR